MSFDTLLAKSQSVIFQPGGVNGGLVVTTWAQVQEFIAFREGTVTVLVDDSLAPALVPAASAITECEGRVEMRAATGLSATLTIQDGATLANLGKVTNSLALKCQAQATPSLSFTQAGTQSFEIDSNASVVVDPIATTAPIMVQAAKQLVVHVDHGAAKSLPGVALASVAATGILSVFLYNGSTLTDNYVSGPATATANLLYDATSASNFPSTGIPPVNGSFAGTYTTVNQDTTGSNIALPVPTSPGLHIDVFAAFAKLGIVTMCVEGFGGGGGGGGGSGGGAGPGTGGGGGGAPPFTSAIIQIDLSHAIDIFIASGGTGGIGGGVGGGAGGDGNLGGNTQIIDSVSGVTLASFIGASGGQGGTLGGAGNGGSNFPPPTGVSTVTTPTAGSGGNGGAGGIQGHPGNFNHASFNPITTEWSGGNGGAAGAAGGGGGGGAGPFGNGGAGGAAGSPGAPGVAGTANTGAGGGGGGGGNGAGDTGGHGGAGGSGGIQCTILL